MPAMHVYRCLNPNCSEAQKGWFNSFEAMNAPTPECPECGSIKLKDCGVPQRPPMIASAEARRVTQHDERSLRRIAEQQGATNIHNRPPQQTVSDGPKHRFNGMDISLNDVTSGKCVNRPEMAQPLSGTWTGQGQGLPGTPKAALKNMTNVVAEHKG